MIAVLDTADDLCRAIQSLGAAVEVHQFCDSGTLLTQERLPDAVLIGPGHPDPIRASQELRGLDVPVVICPPPGRGEDIQKAVRFSPLLPRDISVILASDAGTIAGIATRAADRSRRRRAFERTVRAANAALAAVEHKPASPVYFNRLLDLAPVGIVVAGADGRIESFNRRTTEMLADVAPGKPAEELFDSAGREALRTLLRGSAPVVALTRRAQTFEARSSVFPNTEGEPRVLIILQDVTEQRAAEMARDAALERERNARAQAEAVSEQLRRMNIELEQFAYVASHDLQEPLRTIASFAQLFARKFKDKVDADGEEYIGRIVDGAKRMRELIQDLLDYSRVTRDEELTREHVDMNRVLTATLEGLRVAIEETAAEVTHDDLPVLPAANTSHMQQLLLNLISNAIKYRREGVPPRVHVGVRRDYAKWRFSVADNGQGFDTRFSDVVFGIFKRLHGKDVPGTGIGLALCKRIVERHGGRIWASSTPGKGSTFYFTIPG
jgi:signal transduction histidine kinase